MLGNIYESGEKCRLDEKRRGKQCIKETGCHVETAWIRVNIVRMWTEEQPMCSDGVSGASAE